MSADGVIPERYARRAKRVHVTSDDVVPAVIHAANCDDLGCEGECDLANIEDMAGIIRELRKAKADEWFRL